MTIWQGLGLADDPRPGAGTAWWRHGMPGWSPALAVATAYGITAALWIALSDDMLLLLIRDAPALGAASKLKGMAFVGVSAFLLFVVLARRDARAAAAERRRLDTARAVHLIFDELPDPLFLLDREVTIRAINCAGLDVLGITAAMALGRSALDLIDPADCERARVEIARVLAGAHVEADLRVRTPAGPVPFRFRSAPVLAADGTVDGMVGSARNISGEIEAARRLRADFAGQEHRLARVIDSIARLTEARDQYTHGHQQRVARIALAIGGHLGLEADRMEGLRLAAVVHDIGKVAVPSDILAKPARLTEAEMAIVRRHPDVGYDVLREIDLPWPVAEIVRQHHERHDGSGYPRGLRGDAICLEARILGVADTLEAMASHRPYRVALGAATAVAEIAAGAGTRYDPAVAGASPTAAQLDALLARAASDRA